MAPMALDDASSGWTEVDGPKTELARSIEELLMEKGPILDEYFSTIIDTKGNLCSLPLLLGMNLMSIWCQLSVNIRNLFRTYIPLHLHSRCTSLNFQTLCAHADAFQHTPEVGCRLYDMQHAVQKLPLPHDRYFW